MGVSKVERVVVFSASGRPGLAQVGALRDLGIPVRAVTRQQRVHPVLEGVEVVAADLNQPETVRAACEGADVVFYTAPTFAERTRSVEHIDLVGRSARDAGVRRVVYNTTSWFPDEPIGVPSMDRGVEMTAALRSTGAASTIICPSLFMDNLLTRWVRPHLMSDAVFAYPHAEDLEVSWISLDDVAKFMIGAALTEELADATIDVGGPEDLRPTDVAARLAVAVGRPVEYRRLTPREFGERMYEVFEATTDQDRETYVSSLERHYEFKNVANPFKVDSSDIAALLGVEREPMSDWIKRQEWTDEGSALIGSVSG